MCLKGERKVRAAQAHSPEDDRGAMNLIGYVRLSYDILLRY